MENLNSIPNLGRWNEIAQLLNENLQKIENELVSLGLSTYKGKGYFESEGVLTNLYPNPQQGDWAIVGGSIYQASLDDNGYYWEDTEKDLSINVDLNEYVKEEIFSEEVAKKLSSVMILPFEGVLEKIDDSELGSGGFVTGTPYSIYYVKNKDCFLSYYNRIFNSSIYDNGVDLMPKYNDSETGKSLKNNLYIDADGNIFAFENGSLKKTISAKTKYTNHAKVNKVLKELFIQKADEELNPSDYYVSVIFKKKYQGVNVQSMCQFQIRSIDTNDTVCQYTDYIEDVEHEPNKLIELKESNDSGISGYAIINWNDFTENIFYYHYYSEGKAFLTNLCLDVSFSPTIYSYVNKAETDSKIKEADERLSEEIETLAEQKAEKEGTYPNLTSGFADNLVGRGEATQEVFTFRQSGGNTSINDGTARLKSIKGNSVVWNQKIKPGMPDYGWGNTIVVDGNKYNITIGSHVPVIKWYTPIKNNHYYYVSYTMKGELNSSFLDTDTFYLGYFTDDTQWLGSKNASEIRNGTSYSIIKKSNADKTGIVLGYYKQSISGRYEQGEVFTIEAPLLIDLTLMFGAGNEPTTVEEFRALYPNDYYEYNEGEIINSNYTAIESVGFNQWDEQWEVGLLSGSNGSNAVSDIAIRSKNYNKCLPNTTYYIDPRTAFFVYDKDKNYIEFTNKEKTYTTPSNAAFFKISTKSAENYGNVYKNDICINLSHTGYRNGQYEPYHKDIINLPNIELKKAGNVYDEIRYNPNSEKWEYVQRVITKAYEDGDADKAYVTTDGVKTNIAVATPIITELEGDYSTDYIVSDFGTEKAITDKLCAPFSADIIYQFNAVDRIRENSAKIEENTQAIVKKQEALTLTVKDNGNIVIGNIQGQTKEFMPATPSGDPNHHVYELYGAIYNDTDNIIKRTDSFGDDIDHLPNCWYLNGLGDLTNENMQASLNYTNTYMWRATTGKLFAGLVGGFVGKFKTNMPTPSANPYNATNGMINANTLCGGRGIIKLRLSYSNTEVYSTFIKESTYMFAGNTVIETIYDYLNVTQCTNFTASFADATKLRNIRLIGLKADISFKVSKDLTNASILYMIQKASSTATFSITLEATAYERAISDTDIRAALTEKTNIKLQSA